MKALSSNIDDRTLHELYSWPFAEGIRAGVGAVMTAYVSSIGLSVWHILEEPSSEDLSLEQLVEVSAPWLQHHLSTSNSFIEGLC